MKGTRLPPGEEEEEEEVIITLLLLRHLSAFKLLMCGSKGIGDSEEDAPNVILNDSLVSPSNKPRVMDANVLRTAPNPTPFHASFIKRYITPHSLTARLYSKIIIGRREDI